METGTVSNPIFPGTIQPDAGGADVKYGDLAVVGTAPGLNDRVKFDRDPSDQSWASSVQLVSSVVMGVAPAAAAFSFAGDVRSSGPRKRFALPGFAGNMSLSMAKEAVEQMSAPGFVVRQKDNFYVLPSRALKRQHPPGSTLSSIVQMHGQLVHEDSGQGVPSLAQTAPRDQLFHADVELPVRSKLWQQMFETATTLQCTLNHKHVYRADEGYETCPRDGAPLEPADR